MLEYQFTLVRQVIKTTNVGQACWHTSCEFNPIGHFAVCSSHFTKESFERFHVRTQVDLLRRLKVYAYPTIWRPKTITKYKFKTKSSLPIFGSQTEIDHLFNSDIVLRNITYGLSVYGAADSELTTIQRFKAKSSLPMLYNYKRQTDNQVAGLHRN